MTLARVHRSWAQASESPGLLGNEGEAGPTQVEGPLEALLGLKLWLTPHCPRFTLAHASHHEIGVNFMWDSNRLQPD